MNEKTFNQTPDKLRSPERISRLEAPKVVEHCLSFREIKSILDIGTGTGLFAEEFNKRNVKVFGIDINEEYLELAKHYVPDGVFLKSTAEELPFIDLKFDATFYGLVFHEVDDYQKALNEAVRVTQFYTFILEWKYQEEQFGPPIEHRLSPDFIKDLASKSSYKDVETIYLSNLVLYKLNKI
jgi:SAM-dependent methyltransferase